MDFQKLITDSRVFFVLFVCALALQACNSNDSNGLPATGEVPAVKSARSPSPSPIPKPSPTAVPTPSPTPSANPSHGPLLSLHADQTQYTAGQMADLTATMSPTEINANLSYFPSSKLDNARLPIRPVAPGQWRSTTHLLQAGTHHWEVTLASMDQKEAQSFQRDLSWYRSHIQQLQKELLQPGLSTAQKVALQARLSEDQYITKQIQENFVASMKTLESDGISVLVIPAPNPSPSPSHAQEEEQ